MLDMLNQNIITLKSCSKVPTLQYTTIDSVVHHLFVIFFVYMKNLYAILMYEILDQLVSRSLRGTT